MAKVKAFIDTDVLTEAKKRIHHIFDIFDRVVVMFSGGKDSLAVLHLVKEVMEERYPEAEHITDEKHHALATKRFDSVLARALKDRSLYPPEYLLGTFMGGAYKREILPMAKGKS